MKYRLAISKEVRAALTRLDQKDKPLLKRVEKEIEKILAYPEIGKPLRHDFKNCRRVRVGSFVLVYEIFEDVVRLADFDHHDKIYK